MHGQRLMNRHNTDHQIKSFAKFTLFKKFQYQRMDDVRCYIIAHVKRSSSMRGAHGVCVVQFYENNNYIFQVLDFNTR